MMSMGYGNLHKSLISLGSEVVNNIWSKPPIPSYGFTPDRVVVVNLDSKFRGFLVPIVLVLGVSRPTKQKRG